MSTSVGEPDALWAFATPGRAANSAPPPSNAAELARKRRLEDRLGSSPSRAIAPSRMLFSVIAAPLSLGRSGIAYLPRTGSHCLFYVSCALLDQDHHGPE